MHEIDFFIEFWWCTEIPIVFIYFPVLCCSNWVWEGQWLQQGSQPATAAWPCGTAAAQTELLGRESRALKNRVWKKIILCDLLKVCIGICPSNLRLIILFSIIIHKPGDHLTKWRINFCYSLFFHLYLFFPLCWW